LVVGVLVVTVVLGLNLISRLDDGQKVLDSARPAFTSERVSTARAGIDVISTNVDAADPIITAKGGASAEVPKLIAFVSKQTGLSQADVVAALQENFPHTLALLQAIPLSSVSEEIPGLLKFLETTLKVSEPQLLDALGTNFPRLTQAITNLPTVTSGWNDIQKIDGLTRFDGTPVKSVPDLRTYFSKDVIPVVEREKGNFASLDGTSTVNWIAPLLLVVGIIVILFALLMIARNLRGRVSRGEAIAGASVVLIVGIGVVGLVLAISLVPRVSDGQKLLDSLGPVQSPARVAGDRAGITMVGAIVKTEDPIMTAKGGGAAEVPKLIAFVSKQTGLSQADVVAALKENFPHTLALLQAIPLSSVSEEIPPLLKFLETALKVSEPQLLDALGTNFPHIAQAVTNLPAVTAAWDDVKVTGTRFDGAPIKTVPDVHAYFSSDVIPVLETRRDDYWNLVSTSNINFIGPLVLIVGIIVILYGLLMLYLAWGLDSRRPRATARPAADAV
jgi:hypothetical protein